MSVGGGGDGTGRGSYDDSSGDSSGTSEPPAGGDEGPSSGDLRSVDPQGEPLSDPAPPNYKSGHPSRPALDHIQNRARGGHPTDPNNLDLKTWEANSRKAGFEGNYTRDLQRLMGQGLSRAEAEYVLQGEADYIVNDVHARPVDPFKLDELPNQSYAEPPDDELVCK
jgi:hypothetical protein